MLCSIKDLLLVLLPKTSIIHTDTLQEKKKEKNSNKSNQQQKSTKKPHKKPTKKTTKKNQQKTQQVWDLLFSQDSNTPLYRIL